MNKKRRKELRNIYEYIKGGVCGGAKTTNIFN